MKNYKIAAIPGDGIGSEVISAGVEVLQTLVQTQQKDLINAAYRYFRYRQTNKPRIDVIS